MSLPTSVTIGTQEWAIVERSRHEDFALLEDTYGYTLERDNVIVIDKDLKPSRKRQVLLHEVLHAIRYVFDRTNVPKKSAEITEWEHYFIGIYEESLLLLLRQNPEFTNYLLNN